MIGFVIKNWRIIALILAALSVLGGLWYYGHTKYRQGWDECALKQEKAEIEGVKNREKVHNEISRLPTTDIDNRLRAKWLRG